MTPNELRDYFNKNFGLNPRPGQFKVDADTYAQCCQEIFKYHGAMFPIDDGFKQIWISVGPNNGLMFKNVELILEILPE